MRILSISDIKMSHTVYCLRYHFVGELGLLLDKYLPRKTKMGYPAIFAPYIRAAIIKSEARDRALTRDFL
jgi:hypothetical protein